MADDREEVIRRLIADPWLAHELVFPHKQASPPFHREMVLLWHARIRAENFIAFRGSAKSTRLEEAVAIEACLRQFNKALLVGGNAILAQERLHNIRRKLERNETLEELFGQLRGSPWGDERLELPWGATIAAIGRGQGIRGTKDEEFRPDLLILDDIEDKDSVRTADQRDKTKRWVFSELFETADPDARIRVHSNMLDPECLAAVLAHPGSGFVTRIYPWHTWDAEGQEVPNWPERFPVEAIREKRTTYASLGMMREYEMEFMCNAERAEDKPFKREHFRYAGQAEIPAYVRTWEPVYCMFDPARSIRPGAHPTGFAAWSWIGPRLVVWEAWGKQLMPNEVVDELFKANDRFAPVEIGFEEDGLNEWALQPIRHEAVRRGELLPLKPVKAPRGKIDFIRGLQVFHAAHEIVFAKGLPDLEAQMLNFPAGTIDIPNALAYAQRLRPGMPMYEDFDAREHVADVLQPQPGRAAILALNANGRYVTGVLVQWIDGAARVLADWVREGEPSAIAEDIVEEAKIVAGDLRYVIPPHHFDAYRNFGLLQSLRRPGRDIRRGGAAERGRAGCRDLLRRRVRGMPGFLVAGGSRKTLNALAGGYCRELLKGGQLSESPQDGPYRVLMEGLESFFAWIKTGDGAEEEESGMNWATNASGRRFITSRPNR